MKKLISLAAVLVAVLITGGCSLYGNSQTSAPRATPAPTATQPAAAPQDNTNAINIKNFSFNPGAITIKKGSTITWANNDSAPHTIKSATFNSEILDKKQSFSFTFNQTGTFSYLCSIHPSMTGKIIVE